MVKIPFIIIVKEHYKKALISDITNIKKNPVNRICANFVAQLEIICLKTYGKQEYYINLVNIIGNS